MLTNQRSSKAQRMRKTGKLQAALLILETITDVPEHWL